MSQIIILYKTALAFFKYKLGLFNEAKRYKQLLLNIRDIKARRIMEIGTWKGIRARSMIEEAKKYSLASEIEYFGFDLFLPMDSSTFKHEISKQPPTMEEVREELAVTGAKISLYQGDTTETVPPLVGSLPKMDLIYIDGGHSYETILSDWRCAESLMHEKTAVIFDDYWLNRRDGAKPIVDSIDQSKYVVSLLPITDVFFNPHFGRLVIKFAKVARRS